MGADKDERSRLRQSLRRCRILTGIFTLLGFTVSVYALYVEVAKTRDPDFKALCDISPGMSCSRVLTSEYSRGLGLISKILGEDSILNQPNCLFGILLYPVFFALGMWGNRLAALVELLMGVVGVLLSIYLACILFLVLQEFCVVCVTIYVLSVFLMGCSARNFNLVHKLAAVGAQRKKKQ